MKDKILIKILILILFAATSSISYSEELWQFFRINAQYRGIIRNSYRDIGCGLAWFNQLSDNKTQMIAHVAAINPENRSDVFAFRINIVIENDNNNYSISEKFYSQYSMIEGERQAQIKQLMALWLHITNHLNSQNALNMSPIIQSQGIRLESNYLRGGAKKEIDAHWRSHGNFSGKFFLDRKYPYGWELEKFRFRGGNVVVSLVQDSAQNVMNQLGQFSPFRELVFDME